MSFPKNTWWINEIYNRKKKIHKTKKSVKNFLIYEKKTH